MTINRPVVIADARYIDGRPQSRVYHAIVNNCLDNRAREVMRLEVDEETAKAFGYKYCGNCRNAEFRDELEEITSTFLSDYGLRELADIIPSSFEVRVYYHGTTKQPKRIWSSKDGESGAERSEKHVPEKSKSSPPKTS